MDQPRTMNLVIDNDVETPALERLIEDYAARIDEQNSQLRDELGHFRAKIRELETIDPYDYTGLAKLYRRHERRLVALLDRVQHKKRDSDPVR